MGYETDSSNYSVFFFDGSFAVSWIRELYDG